MADDQDIERAEQERLKGGMGQQDGAGQAAEAAGLAANDQAGGGLGQNQTGYGGGNAAAPSDGADTAQDAEAQASQGVGTRSDNIGPSPTGANQPRSATTGGPDLSSGLKDSNRGSGNF